jgi:hypothetical protein
MFTTIFWIIQVIMGSFALLIVGLAVWVIIEGLINDLK